MLYVLSNRGVEVEAMPTSSWAYLESFSGRLVAVFVRGCALTGPSWNELGAIVSRCGDYLGAIGDHRRPSDGYVVIFGGMCEATG